MSGQEEQITGLAKDKTTEREDSQEQPERSRIGIITEEKLVRRSERPRTLTEKSRGMYEEKISSHLCMEDGDIKLNTPRKHYHQIDYLMIQTNHIIVEVCALSADVQCVNDEL